MRYSISLHPAVIEKDIPALDAFWRGAVRDAIRGKLVSEPELYGKPLRQSLKGHRSLRVGDYRIVFRIENAVIRIIAILHRSSNYKGVDKRI